MVGSIISCFEGQDCDFHINLCGCVDGFTEGERIKLIDASADAKNGMLSKLRYIAPMGEDADVYVFVDDDFIFPKDWASRLISFSEENDWDILGNKIFLPNGDRFWDRCTRFPHRMVDYSHDENDNALYQTGGFWVMSKDCFDNLKWDPSIPINADRKGFAYNEDVDMSIRAYDQGYTISFDENNTVWHNDESYFQQESIVSRRAPKK
jgi:GT2 family glycosyltransferase